MVPLPDVDLVLLDVNETLSDTSALAATFEDVGAPGALAATWFASVLRDGFALLAAGTAAPFADVARASATTLLSGVVPPERLGHAADAAVAAVARLPLHPDVPGGLRALRGAGLRVGTLTNGSTAVSEALLERAGVRDQVERLLSVADAPGGAWKPARSAYRYALDAWGVQPHRAVLVAVHPWDVDGAARAGLRTAWVDRAGTPYPAVSTAPDVTVTSLEELPGHLR